MSCTFNYIEKQNISETEKIRLNEVHVQVFQDAVDSKAFRKFNNKLYTLKNNIQAAYNFVSSTNKKLGAKVASIQTEAPGRHKLSVDVLPVSKELQGVLFANVENRNGIKIQNISSLGKLEGEKLGSEKGVIGVNKQQLMMLLGSTMYNKPLAQVAVKELLQNSFDAVKTRQNKQKVITVTNKSLKNLSLEDYQILQNLILDHQAALNDYQENRDDEDITMNVAYIKSDLNKFFEEHGIFSKKTRNGYPEDDITLEDLESSGTKDLIDETNVTPGNINININMKDRTISIKDDGIGMTPEIVKNAFLSIGGTNKEGLSTGERSGGLGLAKVQFLMGSESVKVVTVRDGIKTSIEATNIQLYNDDFEIHTEESNEPNGSFVQVKIPKDYKTIEGSTREIEFPGRWDGWKSYDILKKPLVGNVDVKVNFTDSSGKSKEDIVPIGNNSTEEVLPPLFSKISFDWGEADLYMSTNKVERADHKILSSGIYQFETNFRDSDYNRVPYDIVVNIKPSVVSTSEQYPFNNQREGFKNTVSNDIDSLNNYLVRYARGESEKEAVEVFSDIKPLPQLDPSKIFTSEEREKIYSDTEKLIAENKQRREDKGEEPAELVWRNVSISSGIITNKKTGEKVNEKEYEKSFKADKDIKNVSPVNTEFFNPQFPQYHNNTNFDYLKIPGALEFITEFGNTVLQMVRFAGDELGYNYKKLASESDKKFFAGISIDKTYGGVHISKIINAIFVNPLSFSPSNLEEAVGIALHATIHEINHTTASGEGAAFTTDLAILYGKIYGTGKYGLYEGLFRSVYKKHFDTFKILKNEYDKSSTKNLSRSFEGNQIKTRDKGDIQSNEANVLTRQPTTKGYTGDRKNSEEDKLGDVIASKLASNNKILFNKEEVKSNAIPDTELRNKYFSQGSTNDAVDVLKKIAQSDHVLNKLANHLIKYSEENNVQIELVEIDQFVPGEELKFNSTNKPGIAYYSPKENKIYLAEFANYKHTGSESTILHEILHSISYDQLKGNETAQDFYKLLEYARANLDKTYAMADEYEFLVALFTNAEFIKNLQNIPPLFGVKEYKNLFEEIFDYLLKVLGITKASNLYEQAFSIATNILENERLQNESLNQVPESQEYQEEEDFELSENEEPFLLANEEEGDTGWQEHIRLVEETEEIHNSDEILDSTPELDALINTQVDRLRNIQKELAQTKKGDPIKRQVLNKRILLVENSIKRLLENKGYYSLLYTQNRTILNGIEVLDNESQEDFKYIQNIIEDSKTLITEIYKVHSELNTEQKALLSDLQVNLGALQNKYNTVNIKVSNKEAEGVGITYQPTSTAKRDIGSLGKWFLSAAEAKDIPELQIISKWLNYAKNKINEQISTLKDTIFRVKQNNPDWREKVKTFYDSKGKFITQSTSEYYEEEKRINQEKDRVIRDPNSTSTQMALAFQSVRDWYIKHAVYSRSDVGDAKYEKDLQDFLSINEDLRIKNPAQFEAELYLFEQENSPQAYLDYIAEVKLDPNHYVPGVRKRIGYRNLLVVPNSTFDNPEYEKIKDDELYLLIRNTIIQAQSLVPRKMTFDVGNFDKVLNEFTLDMSEQDPFTIKGLLGGLGKNFTEWFTQAKEGSNLTFNAVDSQGNDISFVLAPDVKKFMESKPEDIFEVLTKFYEMAVVYDQNSKILPTLQLYSDKLAERPKIKTNKFGTPLHKPKLLNGKIQRDSNGKIIKEEKPEEIKSGLQNARDLALFTIKSQIFGETKADEDTTFAFWMDKLINYTRLLGIGLKPFSAINNFIIGKLNNYAWAAKGTDFDDKSLLRAQNVIYGNILKAFNIDKSIGKDAKKLALLLDKYNILGSGINKFEGDLQNKFTDIMYFLMTSGEYMIHSEGFIAKMMHTPLTRLDGKEGTLWDYIQINDKDEVTYNTKEYGKQNFEEISPNSKLNNWLYQYNEYRKSTQGDYSNPLYVNQYAWGRALMIFRRWLPQAAYQRFGRESEDKNFKGRFLSVKDINVFYKKGSTNSVVPVIKTIARLVGEATYLNAARRRFKGQDFEAEYKALGLQDVDIKNMMVNIREMRLAAWMFLIVLALGAANDGDDPELNLAVNTASRLFQDLTFFASPTSAFSIIRNPLPIITTIEKFNEVKDNALNYLGGGNDIYQKGIYEGKSKLGVSIVKATPGLAAIPSTISTINQEFSSTSYKYSK